MNLGGWLGLAILVSTVMSIFSIALKPNSGNLTNCIVPVDWTSSAQQPDQMERYFRIYPKVTTSKKCESESICF